MKSLTQISGMLVVVGMLFVLVGCIHRYYTQVPMIPSYVYSHKLDLGSVQAIYDDAIAVYDREFSESTDEEKLIVNYGYSYNALLHIMRLEMKPDSQQAEDAVFDLLVRIDQKRSPEGTIQGYINGLRRSRDSIAQSYVDDGDGRRGLHHYESLIARIEAYLEEKEAQTPEQDHPEG